MSRTSIGPVIVTVLVAGFASGAHAADNCSKSHNQSSAASANALPGPTVDVTLLAEGPIARARLNAAAVRGELIYGAQPGGCETVSHWRRSCPADL